MKIAAALGICLLSVSAGALEPKFPEPGPTAFESFVGHRNSRIQLIHDTPRVRGGSGWIEIKSISVRNSTSHPNERHGLQIVVRYSPRRDVVYMSYESTLALKDRLSGLRDSAIKFQRSSMPAVLSTSDCAPSSANARLHELCVGLYHREGESGVVVSTRPNMKLHLPNFDLRELIDVVNEHIEAIELAGLVRAR